MKGENKTNFVDEFDDIDVIENELIENFFNDDWVNSDANLTSFDALPERSRLEALKRLKVIAYVKKRLKGGWTQKNLEPILKALPLNISDTPPSWRTLVEWKKVYYESGKSITALIPKHNNKGKRDKLVDSQYLVDEAIGKKYLTRERVSVADTYRYYKARVYEVNKKVVEGQVSLLSERTFYLRVKELAPYDVAFHRYGKLYADRMFRSVGQLIPATMPMEYVEIDHTPAPIILLDDELGVPLGRPHLTILFDRYSKCIVGLSVNFREPSFHSVSKAMVNSMLDKSWLKEKYPSINKDWPCQGKIQTLVVDNGAEFWSKSLEDALLPFVTDIQYCSTAKPWRKSGIEKFFDQFNKGLINGLPGKTFTNPTQLDGYDPKKDAVVSVSTFLELMHKWIVDYYHFSPDSKSRFIPYDEWTKSTYMPNIYSGIEAERLKIEMGILEEREIGKGGIKLNNIRYESSELIDIRKYRSRFDLKVKVKVDPSDISFIHVFDEEGNKYIKVPAVDNTGYTKGLSLFQHHIIQRVRRLNTKAKVNEEELSETKLYLERRLEAEQEKIKLSSKKKSQPKTSCTSKLAKYKDVGSENSTIVNNDISALEGTKQENNISNLGDFDFDFSDIEGY